MVIIIYGQDTCEHCSWNNVKCIEKTKYINKKNMIFAVTISI